MKKRILVAPLNWGLGHATRCIPIINALLFNNFEPIIASDGVALTLLKKEFPNIKCIELPSYNVTYAKNGKHFKLKLIKDSPKLLKAIKAEKKVIKSIIETEGISGIISDNRLGVRNKNIPSVFITHQLNVLSGSTTWLSTKMHQKFINKFNACWVPDTPGEINLSGKLGHVKQFEIPTTYIGPLSRFTKKDVEIKNDIMVLISGPEPQRSMLEEKILTEIKGYSGRLVLVRGVMESDQTKSVNENLTIYNYMTSKLLEQTINESALVISRSGYTTVMDLAKLNKKAIFIPTPGQFEQEYLSKRLSTMRLVPTCNQDDFNLNILNQLNGFAGLNSFNYEVNFKKLFSLFERE